MSEDTPVAELRGINKIYGDGVPTQVLFDIDLLVRPGEFAAIVGASGSGKTTLLNIIGLLDTPTSGELILGGEDAARLEENERARFRREYLGFIFQFHYLLPEFTVLENAMIPCRLSKKDCRGEPQDRMVGLLEQVGLGDRLTYRPSQLSGGQQQRVAIVRALANDPDLVLADEPTGNLDSKSSNAVFDLMRELNRTTGKAFLMVTHDETFARQADRVIHIVDGRIERD
ncbi:MAG: ABC transporter ATP-binding protein [Armatimonadota bacterium]|nr:ABC transporter ATP-binding protein [bacterium]